MSKQLILYDNQKNDLPEIAFIKDIPNQTKIRNISGYELSKQLGIVLTEVITAVGIKGELDDYSKKDIKELLLMRFKNLSMNELYYAFKLERYGILGERIEHFQLFDATYVGKVLEKYMKWKIATKAEHQISYALPQPSVPEEVKLERRNSAIRKAWEYFLKTHGLLEGYQFIYEELMQQGFLNDELEFKKKIHKSAIELLEMEYKTKEATDIAERKKFNKILEDIRKPKQPIVILKCKELSILSSFRALKKDKKQLEKFKTLYQIP